MLIKEKDSQESAIQQLEAIITRKDLPYSIVEKAKRELYTLKAGIQGEKDAAYFINFDFAKRKTVAIIHDLRIEHNGYVAQIDHLLMTRFLEFYILESKSFSKGLKITDRGEFLVGYDNNFKAIESPIEQNRRHGELFWNLLCNNPMLPTRLGIKLQPKVIAYVLVSPKSLIKRPASKTFNTDMVIKADTLKSAIELRDEKASTLGMISDFASMVPSETVEQIARSLVAMHKPFSIDYYAKFGIPKDTASPSGQKVNQQLDTKNTRSTSDKYCFKCRKSISQRVYEYCLDNKKRFNGRAYCLDCQKSF